MVKKEENRDLNVLVQRTKGPQPWRRAFHAANGLILVSILQWSSLDPGLVLRVLGGILGLLLLLDGVRLTLPRMNRLFFRVFSPLASPREAGGPASSTWYVLGALLTLLLFPLHLAQGGILVLALADPAASLLGRAFGTRPFGTGTLEGTAVFVSVAFLSLLPFAPWLPALMAALVAAMVEVIRWPLDDNLTLPLVTAAVLSLLA
ncbi:MAG: hypothetical protein ACQET1_09400 [Gemmatimonadota bacterium]